MTLSYPDPSYQELFRPDTEPSSVEVEPGLTRRILSQSSQLMLVEHRMQAGWAGTRHSHPHEQLVYVLLGHLIFECGAERFEVRAGDNFVVPGGMPHQASAVVESVVLDVFTPPREDFL